MKDNKCSLDDLNNNRVEESKNTVAKVMCILNNPVQCLLEKNEIESAKKDIAKSIGMIENATQEMKWACEHFKWDTGICDTLETASFHLGQCLAMLIDNTESDMIDIAGFEGQSALTQLSYALASLVMWFD